jgi:hypothetical protein
MMNRRAPVPATGWGCFRCGLPMDGALYMACDECVRNEIPPVEVCSGKPSTKIRVPADTLGDEPFDHDYSKHPEVISARGSG